MILLFPDTDTFRLAVTTGIVPAEVVLAPAKVSTDADGRPYVETDAKNPNIFFSHPHMLFVLGHRAFSNCSNTMLQFPNLRS